MSPDDPEVRGFLARSMVTRVATLSRKGLPHITALRFVCDQGRIYMITGEGSPAVHHISAHPAMILLFDAERARPPNRVLRVRGRATVSKEEGLRQMFVRRAARKYFLCPGGLWDMLTHFRKLRLWVRGYAGGRGRAAVIEVVPETAEFLPLVRY